MATTSQASQNEWEVWNAGNVDFTRYIACPFTAAASSQQGKGYVFKAYQKGSNMGRPIYQVKSDGKKQLLRRTVNARSELDTSIRRKFDLKTGFSLYSVNPRAQEGVEAWLYVHKDDYDLLIKNCPAFHSSKAFPTGSEAKESFKIYEDSTPGP